jgi:cell division protein ZapA (FtsZ GTPase activity inhibitor)
MNTVKVVLLGEEVTLRGEEETAYLEKLASEVELMVKRTTSEQGLHGRPTRAALLVAMNLLDELTKLREKHARLEQATSSAMADLVKRIDHTLKIAEAPAEP